MPAEHSHVLSIMHGQPLILYVDENGSKWRGLQQIHTDWSSQHGSIRIDNSYSGGRWRLVALHTRRGACRRRWWWWRWWDTHIVETNITDVKKLQLLTPGVAKLQAGRLTKQVDWQFLSTNKLNFPRVVAAEADLKRLSLKRPVVLSSSHLLGMQ